MNIKKIGIITRHAVPNYGSFLQAYATQYLLENMGYEVEILDYNRTDENPNELIRAYTKNKGLVNKIYFNTVWRFSHFVINRKMRKARTTYLNLSNAVDEKNIAGEISKYDILLTGSDQVWNVVGVGENEKIDENYFWNNAPQNSNILSYSASFGDTSLKDEDYEKCKKLLNKFKSISVREDSGVEILNKMGYDAFQVLDPTLSINTDAWGNLAQKCNLKKNKPYVLVYNLHSNSNMYDAIKEKYKKEKIEVRSIKTTFRKSVGKSEFCPSIEEFLWLFKNAECIYADSFHAIAFSIIFKRPFIITLPKLYSTRLESILRLFNLEDRISDDENINWEEREIDWEKVYSKFDLEQKKSVDWLEKALSDL